MERGTLDAFELYIFDIDGTLTITKSGNQFREGADDWQWIDGRLEILRSLHAQGNKVLAFASNQGGVAFGYFTEAEMLTEMTQMAYHITGSLETPFYIGVCFSHPKGTITEYAKDDVRRKPQPGMLLEIAQRYLIPPYKCLVVGDRPEDRKAAGAAHMLYMDHADFFAAMEPDPRCHCGKHADVYCQFCHAWQCMACHYTDHLPAEGQSIEDFLMGYDAHGNLKF